MHKRLKSIISYLILFTIVYLLLISFVSSASALPKRYAYPKDLSLYDIDFWNVTKAKTDPLNVTYIEQRNITYSDNEISSINLTIIDLTFISEYYGGQNIVISGRLIYPSEVNETLPAVIMFHGYGGSKDGFFEIMLYTAARGYVTLAIDAPGSGDSSPFPSNAPTNIVNVSGGPQGAYYYHVVWSGLRGITLLTSLDFVDKNKIVALGGSMGGIETFIIAAIDDRVSAAIPIVASGNYMDLLKAGTLANVMVPPNVTLTGDHSYLVEDMLKYFDVYAYASRIKIPILLLESTFDEYFTLYSINDTCNVIPSDEKYLTITPNWNHALYLDWIYTTLTFLDSQFKGKEGLPKISFTYTHSYYGFLDYLFVASNVTEEYNLTLVWRYGIPGSSWQETPLTYCGKCNELLGRVPGILPGKIMFYVAAYKNGILVTTTRVYEIESNAILVPLIAIFLMLIEISFVGYTLTSVYEYLVRVLKQQENIIKYITWAVSLLGLMLPVIGFVGRTELTIWQFIEQYGFPLGIIPWAAYLLVAYYTISFIVISIPKYSKLGAIMLLIPPILITGLILALMTLAENVIAIYFAMGVYVLYIAPFITIAWVIYKHITERKQKVEKVEL